MNIETIYSVQVLISTATELVVFCLYSCPIRPTKDIIKSFSRLYINHI